MKPFNRYKRIGVGLAAMLMGAAAVGSFAQQGETKKPAASSAMCQEMCQSMKPGGEIAKLAGQLVANSSALEKEKDKSVLKKKLAENTALAKSLEAKLNEHASMMGKMMNDGEGMCPMPMGDMPGMGNMPEHNMSMPPGHKM